MFNNSEKTSKLTNDKIVKLGHKIAVTELKSFLSSKGFTRKLFGPYTDKDSGGDKRKNPNYYEFDNQYISTGLIKTLP